MLVTIPAPVRSRPKPSSARRGRSLAAAGGFALVSEVAGTPCWTTVPAGAGSVVTCAHDNTGLAAMLRRSAMKRNGRRRKMMIRCPDRMALAEQVRFGLLDWVDRRSRGLRNGTPLRRANKGGASPTPRAFRPGRRALPPAAYFAASALGHAATTSAPIFPSATCASLSTTQRMSVFCFVNPHATTRD